MFITGENTDATFKTSDDAEVKDFVPTLDQVVLSITLQVMGLQQVEIDNDVVTNGEGEDLTIGGQQLSR